MAALLTLAALPALAVIVLYFIRLYQKSTNGICISLKSLEGKTAVVTGGTAGMGLEIAKEFARRKARVIIACPFENEGINAQKSIVEKTGNKNIVFKHLDLGSLDSVRAFAADILKTEDRLDLLMNNAGVGVPKNFKTKDGLNFIMQVNYYGHFLLTILLLPLLKKTGQPSEPARVVNTASLLHYIGRVDLNPKSGLSWVPVISYSNSKFCTIPFSRELTRRLKGTPVVINNVDPGAVGTGIFNSAGWLSGFFLARFNSYYFKTPREGAQTAIHVALDDRAGQISGELFKDCKRARAKSTAYRDKTARILWEESVRLVRLADEELERCLN